jgi:effector-binding domain-containing protein
MLTLPKIVDRVEQPYVAIKSRITVQEIGPTAQNLMPELFGWLRDHGIEPAGPEFLKYNVIDMKRKLEIEFGVPTASPVSGDERVLAGALPSGRYATLIYRGPYDRLYDANAALIDWAKKKSIKWDMSETGEGDRFGCRLEVYLTDPETELDPVKRETEVTIRLAN